MDINLNEAFEPISYIIEATLDKTAASHASDTYSLASDAYIAGVESGLGMSEEGTTDLCKAASCLVGREAMMEIIPNLFLSKN